MVDRLHDAFDAVDTDGDGLVGVADVAAVLVRLGDAPAAAAAAARAWEEARDPAAPAGAPLTFAEFARVYSTLPAAPRAVDDARARDLAAQARALRARARRLPSSELSPGDRVRAYAARV